MSRFGVAFGFTPQASQIMSKNGIVRLNRIGLCLGLNVPCSRNELCVRFPVIGHDMSNRLVFDTLPELLTCFVSSRAQHSIDEPFLMSINSNPYPTGVFFDLI